MIEAIKSMRGRQAGQRDGRVAPSAEIAEPVGTAPRNRQRDHNALLRMGGKRRAKRWSRNASDELAIDQGCMFDEYRADHFRAVLHDHFRFWEGTCAGNDFDLLPYQWEDLAPLWGWVVWDEHLAKWVRRFRRASIWWPKKNGKSPIAGATTLYLLKWDSEPGQHVYNAARDGKQAGLIFGHACNMIHKMSMLLKSHFGINRSTKSISFQATFSDAKVLPCDNVEAQEGLNGSVVIDEAHVVNDKLAVVLADMGAHRSEPLQISFSTAGGSPTGFGRKEWEYGEAVNSGKYPDWRYYHRHHGAPQDATDADCSREEIWQEANPGWGSLINPEEFRDSYKKARRSSFDFSNWKQRRLNIWQKTGSLFIDEGLWKGLARSYTLEDLRGLGGSLGIDLARVNDTASAVFVCRKGEEVYLWPMIWLPRATAVRLEGQVPFADWERAGHIKLSESDATNFDVIQAELEEVIGVIGTENCVFDQAMMLDFAQRINDSTGIEMMPMKQTFEAYGKPTADLERYCIDNNLRHPGNHVMTWHLGNCYVKEVAGKRKVMKDAQWGHRTIDSIQAAIMGIKGLDECGQADSSFLPGGYWDKWLKAKEPANSAAS